MALNWLHSEYNATIYITENGVSDRNSTLEDQYRINYMRDHIDEVLKGQMVCVCVCVCACVCVCVCVFACV